MKKWVLVRVLAVGAWLLPTANASTGGPAATVCTWGGTPAATTGTFTVKPGLTNTPADRDLKILATGQMECSDGFTGEVIFDGVIQAGGTCAVQVFEGKVKGLPGVERLFGPGVFGQAHEFYYDKAGNVVGSDQLQVLSGVGEGSELSDCNTEKGFTHGVFSSVVELWG